MANKKSTRKHNKLLTGKANYYSDGGINWRLKDNTDPSVAKTGFKGALNSGTLSGVGSAVGQLGEGIIGGGLESGAGKVISGLGSVASAIPGPWGAVASAGLGLVGGLVNRMFGSKMNKENIAATEQGINAAQSFTSNASDYDSLSEIMGNTASMSNFSNSYIGKDGWFSNKVKKKARALRAEMEQANARQELALTNNADNIANSVMSNLAANYAAFGGPLDMGPLEYDLQRRFLNAKELDAIGQNKSIVSLPNSFNSFEPSMFADGGKIYIKPENRGKFTALKERTGKSATWFKEHGTPAQKKMATFALNARKWKHAEGGPMHTHGGIFSNGLMEINNGDTHEANPFEGVPMGIDQEGTPNLVEEGETIFNDYVFSNRLKVPKAVREKYKLRGKKNITFADASKKLAKESEERPNDPISMRGLEALLSDLAMEQEELKSKNSNKKFSKGGSMNKYDGRSMPTQKLNTYKNFSQLSKDTDFYTQEYLDFWNYMNDPANAEQAQRFVDRINSGEFGGIGGNTLTIADANRLARDFKKGPVHQAYSTFVNEGYRPIEANKLGPVLSGIEEPAIQLPNKLSSNELDTFTGGRPVGSYKDGDTEYKKLPTWMRYAPAVGLGISAITDAVGWTNKPDYSNADAVLAATRENTVNPVRFNPIGNYLEYSPFDRDYYINKLNAQSGATRRAIGQNAGLNRGAGMAALLAADYNAQNQFGELARQAEEYNLAQRQKVEEFNRGTNMANSQGFLQADMANQRARSELQGLNLKASLAAAEMRERARLASDQAKSANLSGFIQSLGDIGRENMAWNWRNFGLATGSFGNVGETEEQLLRNTRYRAKGGKIRKRKGLTY